jgi:hypothetical protein
LNQETEPFKNLTYEKVKLFIKNELKTTGKCANISLKNVNNYPAIWYREVLN